MQPLRKKTDMKRDVLSFLDSMGLLGTRVLRQLLRMVSLTVAAGVVCACLVRFAPGSAIDERELDLRLNEQSRAALQLENEARKNLGAALSVYFHGLVHGDLGYSRSRNAPIAQLIGDGAPETVKEVCSGLALSWVAGLGLALLSGESGAGRILGFGAMSATGVLLSLPAALLAYLCLSAGAKVEIVFALVLTPKIYRICSSLLNQARSAAHVEIARAWGLSEIRILLVYVLPGATPQIVALAATTVALAVGAAIPIETICDVPGIGRLAWQAATARDLPLLVNLTMLVALSTTAAAAASEWIPASASLKREAVA